MAGPGTGKSRFGQEISKALIDPVFVKNQFLLRLAQTNMIVLNITFNGATKACLDAQYPMGQRMAVRLLLSYFHPKARKPMSSLMMAEIYSSPLFKNLTLCQAIDTILQYHDQFFRHGKDHHLEVENDSSGKKGVLFICIDDVADIVKTTTTTTTAAAGVYVDRADLKYMMDMLGMLSITGFDEYFFISIVCDTIFKSIKVVSTSQPFVNIALPSLREVDLDVLCQNMLGLERWKSFSEQEMLLIIIKYRMSEISIPRFVIQALEDLRSDEYSGEISGILYRIREETIRRIKQSLRVDGLVAADNFPLLMRWAVYTSFINHACITEELVDLENAGWISLEQVTGESLRYDEHRREVISLVIFHCLPSEVTVNLTDDIFHFVDALKNAGPHWHELKDLLARYEAIKGAAYREVYRRTEAVSLQEYYFGAVVGSAVRDVRMDLSSSLSQLLTTTSAHSKVPETRTTTTTTDDHSSLRLVEAAHQQNTSSSLPPIDPLKASFVLKNPDGAVIDVLISSPLLPPNTYSYSDYGSNNSRRLWRAMYLRQNPSTTTAFFDIEKDVSVWCNQLSALKNVVPKMVSSIVPVFFIVNRPLRSGSTEDPVKAFGILRDVAYPKVPATTTTTTTTTTSSSSSSSKNQTWKSAVHRSIFITQNTFPKYFGSVLGTTLLLAFKRMSKK